MWRLTDLTPEDYEAALALWNSIPGVRANETREEFSRILARNPQFSAAARADGQLVGAVLCCHDGRRGYLYHLAVDSRCRGQGIGRALVEQSLEKLQAAGISRCTIFVISDNHAGGEFWRHLGFFDRVDLKALAIDLEAAR
jgi:ribosomal protein S18 acetylase RimI-like enzyme